jgi:hypothetical protein
MSIDRKGNVPDYCPQIPMSRETIKALSWKGLKRLALAYGVVALLVALARFLLGLV